MDRRKLAAIVFSSPEKLKQLTDIVWPAIEKLARERIETLASEEEGKVIVLEAAMMIEAGWNSLVDELWMTHVPVHVAIPRLMRRNNLSEEEAAKRIASQMTNEKRAKSCDVLIATVDEPAKVAEHVEKVYLERKRLRNL